MNNLCWYVLAQQLSHCYVQILWLLIWTGQDRERFYVSSTAMETKYRIWTQISRVHSLVVKGADRRSAGPWFNSGRRSWIHTDWRIHQNNIMSPITTTITMPITTIPRKSVNMVAELALWIPTPPNVRRDYSAVTKAITASAVALDTKARAAPNLNSPGLKPRFCMRLLSSHRTNSDPTPWWTGCSGSECPHWLEVPAGVRMPGRLMILHTLRAAHSTGRGPVDHRDRRLEDDGRRPREWYSSVRRHNARLPGNPSKSRGVQSLQQESV